jgi:hypothetical protein
VSASLLIADVVVSCVGDREEKLEVVLLVGGPTNQHSACGLIQAAFLPFFFALSGMHLFLHILSSSFFWVLDVLVRIMSSVQEVTHRTCHSFVLGAQKNRTIALASFGSTGSFP